VTTMLALDQRVAELRRAFDRAFASPATRTIGDTEDMLAIRIAGDPYALRVSEMSGLATGKKIAFLPSRRPSVVGIAGVRGSLLVVHSLSVLLGYGPHPSPSTWLALSIGDDPLGLGFDELEGFLRVRRADVHPVDGTEATQHVRDMARVAEGARPVVSIRSTIEILKARAGAAGPTGEG
jgi:chemotaxis signal transduction protein